jgi:hypothetical protein
MSFNRITAPTLFLLSLLLVSSCDGSTSPPPAPVANAGPDQPNANEGHPVSLNGGGSYDTKNKPLFYAWAFVTRPSGSAATLAGANTSMASFTPDVGGQYVVQLTVDNGKLTDADECIVTVNGRPVADAGQDQSVTIGQSVRLDGTGSHDPEGNPLSHEWVFESRPEGSLAFLSDPTAPRPTFTPDRSGLYVVTLMVNDGALDSDPDECVISVNTPPRADAGPDAHTAVGRFYELDGTGSGDPDGDVLAFSWSLGVPPGSTASLVNPNTSKPGFTPDVAGDYVATLVVNDGQESSDPDLVTIHADPNAPPLSQAGYDRAVSVGEVVELDGSQSTDPEGLPLEYSWAFVSRPSGSAAVLSMPTAVNPTFTPDVEGAYIVRLSVTDPGGLTDSDDVTITAEPSRSITGTWSGEDEMGATWTLTLVEEQGTGSVSGEAELSYLGTVILGGGAVSGSRTDFEVELTITFSGYAPAVFTGTVSADGGTLEGQLNGSGYENSALTLTRISGSSPGPAAVSGPVVPGNDLLAEFLRRKVKI